MRSIDSSILFPVSFLFALFFCILILKSIRPKFPVKVPCWFCGCRNSVPYHQQNSWVCQSCEQYNGFTEDGDYNKPIPAQYDMCDHAHTACQRGEYISRGDMLCQRCSNNQALKVKQLANFIPQHNETYHMEVEAFRQHIEMVYRLCYKCQSVVDRELDKQDYLLQTKLDRLRAEASQPVAASTVNSGGDKHTGRLVWCVDVLRSLHSLCGWLTLTFVLEVMTLMCAVILLYLDNTLGLQWLGQYVPSVPGLSSVKTYLYVLFPHGYSIMGQTGISPQQSIATTGALTLIIKLLLSRKGCSHVDLLSMLLWICILVECWSDLDLDTLPVPHHLSLSLFCHVIIIGLSLYNIIILYMYKSHKHTRLSIRRLSLDSSQSIGTDFTTLDTGSIHGNHGSETPSQQHRASVNNTRHYTSPSLTSKASLDDTVTSLESFTLGPVQYKNRKGLFDQWRDTASGYTLEDAKDVSRSLRHRKPLISPAKFIHSSLRTETSKEKAHSTGTGKSSRSFSMRDDHNGKDNYMYMTTGSTYPTDDSTVDSTTDCDTAPDDTVPDGKVWNMSTFFGVILFVSVITNMYLVYTISY